ncbi:PadR family transcriptional regulator [Parasphingorhabdus sp.]
MHGYEIMKTAGIKPGTLYPMLARLEDQGLLNSEWEKTGVEGRPPRHIYCLTQAGRTFTAKLIDDRHATSAQKLSPKST